MNKVTILSTDKKTSDYSDIFITRLVKELVAEVLSFNFYKKGLSLSDFTKEEDAAFRDVLMSNVCWEQYYIPDTKTIELVYDKFLVWISLDKEIKHSITVKCLDDNLRFDEYCTLESDLFHSLIPIAIFTAITTFYPVSTGETVTLSELKESVCKLMFNNKPDSYPAGLMDNILRWVDRLLAFSLDSFINLIYSGVSFDNGAIAVPSFLLPRIHPTMDINVIREAAEANNGIEYRGRSDRSECSVYPLLVLKHDGEEVSLEELKLNIFGSIQHKHDGIASYINYAIILDLLA